jgi:hypothetical protein
MKNILKYLTIFIFQSVALITLAQKPVKIDTSLKPYNRAVIWRGFSHTWSYNHRVNKLGSYVYMDPNGIPKGKHYSASGLGSDSTDFEIYYSFIESPQLTFYQGEAKILVTGKETQLLNASEWIAAYVPHYMRDKGRYKTFLNGFEIASKERSDLPIMFDVHLDDPIYSDVSKEIKFVANLNWVANCRSAECSIFKNTTTYELTIHYLIVGYEPNDAISFEFLNTKSYSWNTDVEPDNSQIIKSFYVFPNMFEAAVIGLKSFGFILNEEQWMQELNFKVNLLNYNKKSGEIQAGLNMLFLDWKEGMKTLATSKAKAMFAHKKAGWVSMNLNSVVLQVKKANLIDGETKGAMYWPGWNLNSANTQSTSEQILKFNY